jgi:hypothetical protein
MSLNFLVLAIGLAVWFLFTKWKWAADSWAARFGELCFFAGLLAYLFAVGSKPVW